MNISCIIVEDEPLARNLLEQYIQKVPYLHLVQSFSNPLASIEFLRENSVDLLFLDIQMPEITGVNLLKIISKKPLVIFTTAYSEYALEGYELDIVDYLLKPITLERFLKAVEKVAQRLHPLKTENGEEKQERATETEVTPHFVFVKDGTKLVKIRLQDILYIEGLKDYVIIHTPQQKVVSLQRMKNLEEQLPANQFIRIHNSYIVSLEAIDAIEKEKVQIGKVFLPVSDTYRKTFKEFIEQKNIKLD